MSYVHCPPLTGNGDAYSERHIAHSGSSEMSWIPGSREEWSNGIDFKDAFRHRRYCTSVRKVDGWRHPSAYWSAASHYQSPVARLEFRQYLWNNGPYYKNTHVGSMYIGAHGNWGFAGPLDPGYWHHASGFSYDSYDYAAYGRCINDALSRVNDPAFTGGTFTAEGLETLQMLANGISSVALFTNYLLKGRLKKAAHAIGIGRDPDVRRFLRSYGDNVPPDASGILANAWIAYAFGWKPLVSDIQAAMSIIKEGLPELRSVVRRRIIQPPKPRPRTNGYRIWDYRITGDVLVETKLFYRLPPSTIATLRQLGLENPLAVGWELTPWSFAVDWLLPVGSFLDAMTGTLGAEFDTGYTTYTLRAKEELTCLSSSFPANTTGTLPSCTLETVCTQRDRHFTWPLTVVYFKSPFTGGERALTQLSLLRQLMG